MIGKKRFYRAFAALLAAVTLLAPVAPAQASAGGFADVSGSDWYYGAVEFVVGKGLFNGTSNSTFTPNGPMTRAMFATVLGRYAKVDPAAWLTGTVTGSDVNLRSGPGTSYNIIGSLGQNASVTICGQSGDWYKVTTSAGEGYMSKDYVSPDRHRFTDVDYGQYYAGYTVWAYEKGIVNGDGSSTKFSPNSNITREEICTMLGRFTNAMGAGLSQSGSASSFPDDASISSWARDSVYLMQRAGIVNGDETGSFRPHGYATRAEAATMLQRFDSACGGLKPPAQNPPAKQPSTPSATPSTKPESGGSTTTPPSTAPESSDPGSVTDTPATLLDSTVSIKSSVIRVGLLVNTKDYDTCVTAVKLKNINGAGFSFGTMSDRSFSASGTTTVDNSITVTTDGSTFTVADSGGSTVYTTSGNLAIRPVSSGKAVTCVNDEYRYYGDFELRQAMYKSGYITVTNFVNIEDYVKGVVPYEFGNWWPAETLKAAAVVCRSYVMSYDWSIFSKYGMDIVGDAGMQTYRGRAITYDESYFSATDAAVNATSGQYLTYNGSVCFTCYSACDGGQTLDSSNGQPYLKGKADPYEAKAKGEISGYDSLVKASHRMGMSQWGAYSMAKYYGKDYKTILGFYYTGTHLQNGA